ncbi:MAG: hypothetical protein EBR82_27375 [Caulobacteraceae bacterium]|nr:hypothetical protein [Caulobacteraceae bacterium]
MTEAKSIMDYASELMDDEPRPSWMYDYHEHTTACEVALTRYQKRSSSKIVREPKTEYERYLSEPHWQTLRLAVLMLSGGKCCRCGDVADDVHHLRYQDEHKRSLRYRERAADVEPVCRECHRRDHDAEQVMKLVRKMTGGVS